MPDKECGGDSQLLPDPEDQCNPGGIQLEDKHHQESGERLQEHEELHEHDLLRLWRIVSPPAANHVELPTINSERPYFNKIKIKIPDIFYTGFAGSPETDKTRTYIVGNNLF